MKHLQHPLAQAVAAALIAFLAAPSMQAQATLISDTFATSGALNGRAPDTTVNDASWVAKTGAGAASASGGVLTLPGSDQTAALDLGENYFGNHPGVYTLSMDVTLPAGDSGANFFGLGFVANPISTVTLSNSGTASGLNPDGGANGGSPWMNIKQDGDAFVYAHGGSYIYRALYSNPGAFPSGIKHTLRLVLDTTQAQWTLNAFIDSTQLDLNAGAPGMTYTFAPNPPNLRYVALTSGTSTLSATVDHFTLTGPPQDQAALMADTFTTSNSLNGRVPDITVNGASWVAKTGAGAASAGGGVLTLPGSDQTAALDLGENYFGNHPDIYTLSMDITLPAGASDANFFGLGFVANPISTVTLSNSGTASGLNPDGGANGGSPWMNIKQDGDAFVYAHGGSYIYRALYSNPGAFPSGTQHTLQLVLDTTQTQWTLNAFIDSTQLDLNAGAPGMTYTFAPNPPDLRYVALTSGTSTLSATVDNFILTAHMPGAAPVFQADALVNSIGVGVHVWVGRSVGNSSIVQAKLTAAGVRHARDWLAIDQPGSADAWKLLETHGIHLCYVITPGWGGIPAMKQYLVSNDLVSSAEFIEGPNEPNTGGGDWAADTRGFCSELYASFANDPLTSHIPILAPALALRAADMTPDHTALGDVSAYADYGNAHPYPGGLTPAANLTSEMQLEKINVGTAPLVVTETGYHNALSTTSGHNPASETATALYLPRLYLEYLALGVRRTYWFDLLDNFTEADAAARGLSDIEAHFGLVRYDFSEKPAYLALKNLIAIMADLGTAFVPAQTTYAVSGSPDVKSLLFQKRNGAYYLAVWRDVSVWSTATRTDVVPASATITVSFPGQKNVDVFFPTTSSDIASSYEQVTSVQIPLRGEVAIVRF